MRNQVLLFIFLCSSNVALLVQYLIVSASPAMKKLDHMSQLICKNLPEPSSLVCLGRSGHSTFCVVRVTNRNFDNNKAELQSTTVQQNKVRAGFYESSNYRQLHDWLYDLLLSFGAVLVLHLFRKITISISFLCGSCHLDDNFFIL